VRDNRRATDQLAGGRLGRCPIRSTPLSRAGSHGPHGWTVASIRLLDSQRVPVTVVRQLSGKWVAW